MKTQADVLYLSHGGGPLPLLGDDDHAEMVQCLREIASVINKPSAIVVVSAHWEARVATLTAGAQPALIYDYSGFPEASYHIEYPCAGKPDLAENIQCVLQQAGIEVALDSQRGFDHGLFVPLKIMYPEADIPCVQLSLLQSLDPESHLAMGRALQNLDLENMLVIGSGFSFHNMRAFFAQPTPETRAWNAAFEDWLIDTCSNPDIDEVSRTTRLSQWAAAPHARYCHPREEHLLPLHVCYGLAGTPCTKHFQLNVLKTQCSMYLWSESH